MTSTGPDLRQQVQEHFEEIAPKYDAYKSRRATYHQALKELAREVFPTPRAMLDIGCGTGEVLAALNPKRAIGVDFSLGMVKEANRKFGSRGWAFLQAEAERLPLEDNLPVDGILSMDTLEHFHSPIDALREMARVAGPGTRILLSWANPMWEPLLNTFERLGLKMPEGPHRWPGLDEIRRQLPELGLRVAKEGKRLLIPGDLGQFSRVVNGWFHSVPGVKELGLIQFLVVEKRGK